VWISIATLCSLLPPVFPKSVPVWAVFTQKNSDLPSNKVLPLAIGADSSLCAGTEDGGVGNFKRPLGRPLIARLRARLTGVRGAAGSDDWTGDEGRGTPRCKQTSAFRHLRAIN
jgi:hypothetical protein